MRTGLLLLAAGAGGFLASALRYWMGNPKHPSADYVAQGWRIGGRGGMWFSGGVAALGLSTVLVAIIAEVL